MKNYILKELVNPLTRRAGTAVGVWLVAQGVDEGTAGQVVTGVSAALLVGIDLLASHLERRKRR